MRKDVVCLLILTIVLTLSLVPDAKAQWTNITNLQAPSVGLVGRDAHITFTVSYSPGHSGIYLYIGIFETENTQYATWVTGSVNASTPNVCYQQASNSASCDFHLSFNTPGSESVDFAFTPQKPQTYNLTADAFMEDSSHNVITDSYSLQTFSMTVSGKYALGVVTQSLVVVTVDGTAQTAGSVYLQLNPGSHTVSVPPIVEVNAGERLMFVGWSDGFNFTTRSVNLQDDTNYTLAYVAQYKLTLTPQGNAAGDGWYDEGTTAQISIPQSIPVVGGIGGTQVFQGWYENGSLVTASSSCSIIMDGPHTLNAQFSTDYTVPAIIIMVVLVIVGAITVANRRRRSTPKETVQNKPDLIKETIVQKKPETTFCINCGSKLPPDSQFCNECGTKQP